MKLRKRKKKWKNITDMWKSIIIWEIWMAEL